MFTEEYFSKWFDIISEHDARTLQNDGDRSFLVLNVEDGTDRYADCFESFEEIERSFPDALFGLDKVKQQRKFQKDGEKMKIYILEEYNTGRTACISEDINMIRKQMCNKDFFNLEYNDYPILKIWKNGVEIEKVEGGDVLKRIAMELRNNG